MEARAAYEILATRERDPKRAAVLRRMADGERGHRTRIEARLKELGAAIPDATSVRLPLWTRIQLRMAPVEKVLAWRESLEDDEAADLYGRPTAKRGQTPCSSTSGRTSGRTLWPQMKCVRAPRPAWRILRAGFGGSSDGRPAPDGLELAGLSTGLGAFIPVLPFFWLRGIRRSFGRR